MSALPKEAALRAEPEGRSKLEAALTFLFGISVTTNVAYLFKVGNTCVYVGYVFAFVMLVAILLKGRGGIAAGIGAIDRSVWLFAGIASLSVIVSLLGSILGALPEDAPLVTLRGLVVLACGLVVYYDVVHLGSLRGYFTTGVTVGLLISCLFSLFQQIAFESGSYFTLYGLFPQDAFSVSAKWEIWAQLPADAGRISVFRPQGLFLEASHLMVFLACFAPLAFKLSKSSLAKVAVVLGTGYCCVFSQSPNVVFLIAEVIVLAVVSRPAGRVPLSQRRFGVGVYLALLAALFAAVLFVLVRSDALSEGLKLLGVAFSDLNVISTTDTGTLERWNSMTKALAAAFSYPFGTGWNTESLILQYLYGSSDVASHSFAIRLLLELGVVGLVSYMWLIWRHARGMVKGCGGRRSAYLGVAVVTLFVCQAANGMAMVPWVWALLGLARAEQLEMQGGVADVRQ